MRRTLLSLSIAAAISLPVLVQANPLTDQGGDQTVSGDQTYTQVQATNGNTLNFTNGSINLKTVESTLSQIRRRRARGTSGLWPSSP